MKGFVNIYKPLNMTSSDAVVLVRGILRRAIGEKQKTGHLGTLDPLATGVLPVAVGNATRLFDYMQKKQKVYVATFKFGITTDTLDSGGKITDSSSVKILGRDIERISDSLTGEIMQMPPQYSAKSIGGVRAYDIARAGGTADLKPKKVEIHSIKQIEAINGTVPLPNGEYTLSDNEFAFEITCGSGTYIRAIARDMAFMLCTVGYMTSLCRIKSGDFELNQAVRIEEFEREPLKHILPMETALKGFVKVDLTDSDGVKALNGVAVTCEQAPTGIPIAVSICGNTVGIGEIHNGKLKLVTRL